MRNQLRAYSWRKRRFRVWKKRLQEQFQLIMLRHSLSMPCTLHVSPGPFYGGSVVIDRQYRRANIYIHIPYDRYVTPDERQVLNRYSLKKNALPYFILFHEFYHFIDALEHLRNHERYNLDHYQILLKKAAHKATNYRGLDVEQRADDFAYQQFVQQCKKAG
ncbi:hypothetical protein [Paenibacillus aestuarii]|uniref:Uncharacterized protein n=1 Tax=Paenibacillus aestuarii TaxID=516965 RepID=A0ABW0K747_9BACL|nr:hypothetical protein [Paenibacillus aestuarii]